MKTPDIEAIRAFLLVADLKSFTRAAEVAGTTQAAISLKIKRLEESLGRALLERTPRRVTLSAQGSVFIASARRLLQSYEDTLRCFDAPRRTLRIGVSHHILGADLSHWLQRLAQADPEVIVAFSLGTSRQMLESYEEGALDIALILRHDNRRQDGEVIGSERFGWMAAESFELDDGAPLPLAIQPAPCGMRSMVSSALQGQNRNWSEAFVGSGILAIGAAVSAGIGIGAMVERMAPAGCVDVRERFGLPELPPRDVVLYCAHRDAQTRALIGALSQAITA
ncbi:MULTISPECIES: LysR family transcriptional regulator [Pseudomonas]|uniref:LysR family transcriptional regulator n=1 Tax=Pseudomonas nitroreducens TaxID=46680 RepID=UPI001E4D0289|nr:MULTISPECIES: LysR family transcriptional regulator [Pseudomonas]MCE4069384.1 LysR family transcriptional regulator [Pseudomonas nitritireducens]MCE4079452.1 LysR family transcriptional regulator [Pseudomonas nitroreducens]